MPVFMLILFETVAITLWLTKGNIFYLFNFSYIGCSIALGILLFVQKYKYARRIVQLLVGLYMLVYLGLSNDSLCCGKDLRSSSFWARLVRLCLLDSDGIGLSSL